MSVENDDWSDAEKLSCFDRVLEILRDRMALEVHMRGRNATFQEILYAREDAYCNLVTAVMGPHALYEMEKSEPAKARRRAAPRAAGAKMSRGGKRPQGA